MGPQHNIFSPADCVVFILIISIVGLIRSKKSQSAKVRKQFVRDGAIRQHRGLITQILFTLLLLGSGACGWCGNPGALDPSFVPGSWINGTVTGVAVQPDGQILICGDFTTVHGAVRNHIARLNVDGSVDNTFNPGTGADSSVSRLVLLGDGKVFIAGDFTRINGIKRNRIARLNADGSLDQSFNPTGPNGYVFCVAEQLDGKILIGGSFGYVNGTNRPSMARLNVNGDLDQSFNPGTGFTDYRGDIESVDSIAVQADGKLLVGGSFWKVNGVGRLGLARLNANGSVDDSFNATANFSYFPSINCITVQSDEKIILGGGLRTTNGNSGGVIRLNANGTLDSTFNSGLAVSYGSVRSVSLQSDGKLVLGGMFTTVNGDHDFVARLNTDGAMDVGFNLSSPPSGVVYAAAAHPSGKVVVVGFFTEINGINRMKVALLNSDGTLDPDFIVDSGVNGAVYATAVQGDGKVFVGGQLNLIRQPHWALWNLARLNADGSLDNTFELADGVGSNGIRCMALQPDGKLLIGGPFYWVNSSDRTSIARLNTDGTVDLSFYAGTVESTSSYPSVESLVLQPNGKVVVGGTFTNINGFGRNRIARSNDDGTVDTTFNPGLGANSTVSAVALQANGSVIIGGSFSLVNGVARNYLARLGANGSLDSTFNPILNSSVRAVASQPDGKLLIAGDFTSINGTNRNRIARLNANGSLDLSFDPGGGAASAVCSILLQSDGKVLIGGYFSTVNSFRYNRIARLNTDGSVDLTFSVGTGMSEQNSAVYALALHSDGNVVAAGSFYDVAGEPRPGVARLFGGNLSLTSSPLMLAPRTNAVVLTWTNSAFTLQSASNLAGSYTDVAGAVSPYTNAITTVPRFFRLKAQ